MDYKKNLSIIGKVQNLGGKEIIAIGSYAQGTDDRAEVAFVVREDYQNLGIGSYLLKFLKKSPGKINISVFRHLFFLKTKPCKKFFMNITLMPRFLMLMKMKSNF
jgi:GNAT superfamily N-acetyltransferase